MQWFDLKALGAKLERSQDDGGPLYLKLTMQEPAPAEAIINSVLEGWVANDAMAGREFRNFREFNRTSTIVASLEPFFSRDVVVMSKVDASRLSQGEELRGYINPVGVELTQSLYPQTSDIAQDLVRMVDAEKRQRILDRVAAAQDAMGVTPGGALFDRRGVEIWHKLAHQVGYHDATEAMMVAVYRSKLAGETFRPYHDGLMRAAEGGEMPNIGLAGPSEERAGLLVAQYQERQELYGDEHAAWDEAFFYRAFVRDMDVNFDAWEGHFFQTPLHEPESFSSKFSADPSMPASWKNRIFDRATRAIEKSAEMLDISPRDLFGDRTIFHLGKRIGIGTALGYHRGFSPKVAGEIIDMRTIKFSPNAAGVMVHEMGHAVDLSHRGHLRGEDIESLLLDDTGIRKHLAGQVARHPDLDPRYAGYLMSPKEMIARSFEASLAEHLRQSGDPEFLSAGGMVSLNGGFDFAPTADFTPAFVKAFTEVLSLTRQYRLDDQELRREASASHSM